MINLQREIRRQRLQAERRRCNFDIRENFPVQSKIDDEQTVREDCITAINTDAQGQTRHPYLFNVS